MTPEQLTQRYLDFGLPATLPADQKTAWEDHQAGHGAPLRLLPKNGATCREETAGGAVCGHPILIDGSCPARTEHLDVVQALEDPNDEFAPEHEPAVQRVIWVRGEFEFIFPVDEVDDDEQTAMDTARERIESVGGRVLRRGEV